MVLVHSQVLSLTQDTDHKWVYEWCEFVDIITIR